LAIETALCYEQDGVHPCKLGIVVQRNANFRVVNIADTVSGKFPAHKDSTIALTRVVKQFEFVGKDGPYIVKKIRMYGPNIEHLGFDLERLDCVADDVINQTWEQIVVAAGHHAERVANEIKVIALTSDDVRIQLTCLCRPGTSSLRCYTTLRMTRSQSRRLLPSSTIQKPKLSCRVKNNVFGQLAHFEFPPKNA
jgi:hypothetical protein